MEGTNSIQSAKDASNSADALATALAAISAPPALQIEHMPIQINDNSPSPVIGAIKASAGGVWREKSPQLLVVNDFVNGGSQWAGIHSGLLMSNGILTHRVDEPPGAISRSIF